MSRWFHDVSTMTHDLVKIASISPDPIGENQCARKICELLRGRGEDSTGLQPELWPTGDGRFNVACRIDGGGADRHQTVLLVGHYDTVDVDEFRLFFLGRSDEIAFQPNLHTAFHEDPSLPDEVRRDLLERVSIDGQSEPAWMFGRGAFDMKSGVAALIAVMRALSQESSNLNGNVLLLVCPDEENESKGILAAVDRLRQLRSEEGLQFVGAINADYTAPRCNDLSRRFVYDGTIGKLLPSFYILGETTHVGEPFRGFDAAQIAAELVRRINLNSNLSDSWPGSQGTEIAMPPTVLQCRDLKSKYNVKTISEAFVYFNWLTLTRTPRAAIEIMKAEARSALDRVLTVRRRSFRPFRGRVPNLENACGRVLTFAELCDRLRERRGWPRPTDDIAE